MKRGIEKVNITFILYLTINFYKTLKSFISPIFRHLKYLMKVNPETSCASKYDIYVFIILVIPTFVLVQIKQIYKHGQ